MSNKLSWSPNYDIDEVLQNFDDSGRNFISPSDYLKSIEDADRALESFETTQFSNTSTEGEISSMLMRTSGVLSADKIEFSAGAQPRISTQFAPKVIMDDLPIFLDDNVFKLTATRNADSKRNSNDDQFSFPYETLSNMSDENGLYAELTNTSSEFSNK